MGGNQPNYGRVETYSSYNWRQVCGTNFDNTDAQVVCRELGYENAINMCCHAFGHLKYALSDGKAFKCVGNETELADCPQEPQTYCPGLPSNYASVYCYNDTLSSGMAMNSMKLVIPLHSMYWSIHTKDESKRGTAFAFIFGVN